MYKITCNWIMKAEKDLKWAERMLEEGDYDYSSFHSQQAAEKALKAVLVALGMRPPKTYDIWTLIDPPNGVVYVDTSGGLMWST